MDMQKLFTEHPESVGETYGEHLAHATGFGVRMVGAGLACMLHAWLPFIFVKTGSQAINELYARMSRRVPPQGRATSQLASAGE